MQHTYSFCLVKDGMYGGYRIIYPDFQSINYTNKSHERCITFAKKRLLSIICNRIRTQNVLPTPTPASCISKKELANQYHFNEADASIHTVTIKFDYDIVVYPACFFKEIDGYKVIFPDLHNLKVHGANRKSAHSNACDLLEYFYKQQNKEGRKLPLPSRKSSVSLQQIADTLEIDFENAFVENVSAIV